jgi:hypothetical protein
MVDIDPSVAHPARRYNYWLGGKDNFAADRQSGDEFAERFPGARIGARANRGMLQRAVRFLTAEAGVRQFLDIGTGLPTADNTHEVAQAVAPDSRIVYVDNDPMVLVHARALLTSTPQGATDYIDADIRDTDTIIQQAGRTLDLDRPVGIMLLGILPFVVDHDQAYAITRRLLDAVPAGSHLVISHPTLQVNRAAVEASREAWTASGSAPICARDPEEIVRFFDGLDLLEPGVVSCSFWRPTSGGVDVEVSEYGGVGRKT